MPDITSAKLQVVNIARKEIKFKLQVLTYSFYFPLVIVACLVLKLIFPKLGFIAIFTPWALLLLLGISFIRTFVDDDTRFLMNIQEEDDHVLLTFCNFLGIKRQLIIRFSTIVDINLRKRRFWLQEPGTITFYSRNNSIRFRMFDADFDRISGQLTIWRNLQATKSEKIS